MRPVATLFITISLIFCSLGCSADKPVYRIYLAGPEVFLPEPVAAGKIKQARITSLVADHQWPFELIGLYPLDNEIADFKADYDTGLRIYFANLELMQKADIIAANMVRFRGPSMDVGTAFEMGYMRGLNKPVFAYYDSEAFYGAKEQPGLYAERVAQHYPISEKNPHRDIYGQSIENFAMPDNLMMVGALTSANGSIADDFDAVIIQIAEYLLDTNIK